MTGRPAHLLAAVLIACAASGCASVSDTAQRRSLAALETEVPRPGPSTPPEKCEPRRPSLAPLRTLPRPGAMPPGTFMETIRKRGHLRVGVDQNSLGLGWFDPEDGEMKGLDPALAWEIVKAIFPNPDRDTHIRYIAISTSQRESVVRKKQVDLVASAYSITCKRQQVMHFSSVYHTAQQRLLVPEDSLVEDLSDLAGERVCATIASTTIERLREAPSVIPHAVALRTDCLVALQEGVVAAVTSDDAILFGFQRQDPQTRIVGPCLAVERYGLAMSRDRPELVRFVNAVLARLKRDGELRRIRERWLGDLQPPTPGEIAECEAG